MDSVPLAPIGGGLHEGVAPGEQPQGTYSQGVNVRGVDPRTGRMVWGAQRAGLKQIGAAFPNGAYPRHFAFAARLLSAREWAELGTTPDATIEPAEVQVAWSTRLGERVLDVAEGPLDGSGYFLLASGDVAVVNAKGTVLDDLRVTSAVPQGFTAVPRVFVDEQGAVYTAATRETPLEGGAGRVYRWMKDTDGLWQRAWESVIEGGIQTFVYGNGTLYVAESGVEDGEDEVAPALSRISGPQLGPEVAWRQTVVPQPVFDLTVSPRGQCFVSSPANEERASASGAGGFTARAVSLRPPEVSLWSELAWAWVDAFAVNEEGSVPADGTSIERMRDRRFEDTEFTPVNDTSPVRDLTAPDSGYFNAPVFKADAFGGMGGIEFDERASLISEPATTLPANIPSTSAIGSTHGTLIPSDAATWTACAIVQFTDSQAVDTVVRRILSQRNVDAGEPDWEVLVDGLDVQVLDNDSSTSSTATTVGTTARTAIITIEHNGTQASVYINGTVVAPALSITSDPRHEGPYAVGNSSLEFEGPFTAVGGGRPNRINLLNHAGTKLALGAAGTFGAESSNLNRLRDGIRQRSGPDFRVIFGGGGFADTLQVDFGSAINFDSFAFWTTSSTRTATTAEVRCGNTYGTWDITQTIELTRGQGDNQGIRDEFALENPTGNPYRYIEIEPLTFYDRSNWQISEFEVFLQDTREVSADQGASFYLGEFISVGTTGAGIREPLEGYIAHRWGVSHTLDAGHPHFGPGNAPTGAGSTSQDAAQVAATLTSENPLLVKYGTDGTPLAAYTGAGVGLGATVSEDRVWAIGDPTPSDDVPSVPDHGTLITRFDDGPRSLTRSAGLASVDRPAQRPTPLVTGPCDSLFVPWAPLSGTTQVRRYNGDTLALEWGLDVLVGLTSVVPGGLQFDGSLQGQGCGPEFLYLADAGLTGAQRVDVLGLRRTGNEAQRDVERLAVLSEGSVYRENGSGWELLEAGALPGPLPFSVYLDGLTVFADGEGYRAYRNATRTFIDFEEEVKGDFPPRCQLMAAYRGRLMLARGDNAFTIYQSAWGDPFDFEYGREVQSLDQAAAGTIASQGRVPEPITALMPFSDDFLFIGTTESLWVLSGDLSDGGRLDQVDRSQGVAFGYAWCHGPERIYYFSARGGVMMLAKDGSSRMVSEGAIQRRLEDIDLDANRVRLAYNFIDQTVHVYVIPNNLGDTTQHFVFEERTGGWHVDDFGEGLSGVVTTADTLSGDNPDDRALMLGFADGRSCAWDQYAADDAGRPVRSSAVVGPVVPDSTNLEVNISGVRATLSSDQGPIQVAARGSNEPDRPGPPGPFRELRPGRGYGVPLNVTAPAVFVEVRGTGRAWSVHQLRAELGRRGRGRNVS